MIHRDYHCDYETYSTIDLKKTNAFRYAEDESSEILMLAVSRSGSDRVLLWLPPQWRGVAPHESLEAEELIDEMRCDPNSRLWAHNAEFERAITKYIDGPLSSLRQHRTKWRCTAALCRKANIPSSLEKAAKYLGLTNVKDSRGKNLLRKFSKLQTSGKLKDRRVLPTDDPEGFRELCEYCRHDVRVEKEIHQQLKRFDLKGLSLDTFLLDVELNDRGIAVNVPALQHAQNLIAAFQTSRFEEFRSLTGGLNPTQKQAFKEWLQTHGISLENMQGVTIQEAVSLYRKKAGESAYQALLIYSELNYTAIKKVASMISNVNRDGRVRGTFLYHGASTGRWSGRGIQPQNFKKATIKSTGVAYQAIRQGLGLSGIDLIFGNPIEVISSCIRHFIDSGTNIFDSDYAAIEARIVCWLADQADALERFKQFDETKDPKFESYRVMAGMIYNRPPESIDSSSQERQLGKTSILGCGFGMGIPKFHATCQNWGLDFVTKDLAQRGVLGYRALHPKVVRLWYAADAAARKAIFCPGKEFKAGEKLAFFSRYVSDKLFLFQRLPSGRLLAYPEPRIEADPDREDGSQITYYGQRVGSAIWGRVKTYGAKLIENSTQGVAADCIACGAKQATKSGYEIFALVHDQALSYKRSGQSLDEFSRLLTTLPDWAEGLPIKAEGKETPYYLK